MSDFDGIAILANRIELGYLARDISFMSRVLRAHVRWANADSDRDSEMLSGSSALLSVIGLNPGISQNDLAAAVVLKKSAVTKIISDLEGHGLVIREKPKADRRYNALRLSSAGQARLEQMQNEARRQQEILLAPLSGREREKLFQLLGRLIVHYADETSAGDRKLQAELG